MNGDGDDLMRALALARAGDAFAAHEALEAAWRRLGDRLFRQDAAQGLIQVCAAYVHRARGNAYGARVLAERGRARLERAAPAAVDEALAAVGIDRALVAARLSALPLDPAHWPPLAALWTGADRGGTP